MVLSTSEVLPFSPFPTPSLSYRFAFTSRLVYAPSTASTLRSPCLFSCFRFLLTEVIVHHEVERRREDGRIRWREEDDEEDSFEDFDGESIRDGSSDGWSDLQARGKKDREGSSEEREERKRRRRRDSSRVAVEAWIAWEDVGSVVERKRV
ncbi:hypothetical protein BDY24DRAFT_386028 [Mrakia frigida]|uniref:uncharacterized protein n=1 Tax=Mrakia frigida TaxID=29902 RepID=UPI003FCBF274